MSSDILWRKLLSTSASSTSCLEQHFLKLVHNASARFDLAAEAGCRLWFITVFQAYLQIVAWVIPARSSKPSPRWCYRALLGPCFSATGDDTQTTALVQTLYWSYPLPYSLPQATIAGSTINWIGLPSKSVSPSSSLWKAWASNSRLRTSKHLGQTPLCNIVLWSCPYDQLTALQIVGRDQTCSATSY